MKLRKSNLYVSMIVKTSLTNSELLSKHVSLLMLMLVVAQEGLFTYLNIAVFDGKDHFR